MKLFSKLSMEEKQEIAKKFELPKNEVIRVDEYNRPFVKNGGRIMCRLKPQYIYGSFHKHELKNK